MLIQRIIREGNTLGWEKEREGDFVRLEECAVCLGGLQKKSYTHTTKGGGDYGYIGIKANNIKMMKEKTVPIALQSTLLLEKRSMKMKMWW